MNSIKRSFGSDGLDLHRVPPEDVLAILVEKVINVRTIIFDVTISDRRPGSPDYGVDFNGAGGKGPIQGMGFLEVGSLDGPQRRVLLVAKGFVEALAISESLTSFITKFPKMLLIILNVSFVESVSKVVKLEDDSMRWVLENQESLFTSGSIRPRVG